MTGPTSAAIVDTVAAFILSLPVWVALFLVFALPALESSAFVGFVFPGEIALILGGVLASQTKVPLAAVLVAGIAGAILGDSIGYVIGRRFGRRVLDGTLGRFINRQHFDRAETYLAERGGKAVFFGRFTAALRVMIPGLAGMSRMHYPKFLAYNVAGGAAWAAMSVMLGYIGGTSWKHVEHLASRIGLGALVLVVGSFVLGYLLRKTRSPWARRQVDRLAHSRAATWTVRRYPRQVAWAGARFDPASRTGLSLTALVALVLAATWTFLGLTQDVVAHEELAGLDPHVLTWVLDHRTAWLNHVMQAVTLVGSNYVLIPILAVVAVVLGRKRGSWRPAIAVVVVYGATLVLHAVVGELVNRPRPPAADWLAHAVGWGYPAGHTIQATAACGILLFLFTKNRAPRVRVRLTLGLSLVVLLIGASEIYLGVHWLTDVLGAMTLGVAILGVAGVTRTSLLIGSRSDDGEPALPETAASSPEPR